MNTNIDNLNFKVILDDDQFNKKIKDMKEAAKDFNTSMSNLLNLEKASQQWSQEEVKNNRRAHQAKVDEYKAQEKINREKIKTDGLQRKINAQIDAATQGYKTQSRILQELKGMALGYLSVHGSMQFLGSLIRITGEFEKERTTLGAMLGDLNQAENIITRIQGLAVESPFTFKELTSYAKQLSAFSVPAEELYDTTKMLADVSAGLGVGMDRLVLAYGQVRSAAFLRGQEVRQFTEAGIPILAELAKQFEELEGRAVSAGEVFDKISARLVPFEMVSKVFKDMTSEGGKFYNMQEIQAETLKGKYDNLKDAIEQTINAIGESQSDKLKGVIDWTRGLVQNYEELGKKIVELVVAFGSYKTTLATIQLLTNTFAQSNVKLVNAFKSASKWLLANPYTLIAAGITAAGLATYKWVTSLSEAERIQKSVTDSNKDFTEELAREEAMLNSLYAKLELTAEGTLENDKAKAKIMQRYSPYIEQLKQEGIEVNNLADIYGYLAQKINESLREKYYESSMQDIESVYNQIEEEVQKRLRSSFESNRKEYILSEKDKMALNMYVLGGLDKDKTYQSLTDSAKKYFSDFTLFIEAQRKVMASANEEYINGMDDLSAAYQYFKKEVESDPIDLSLFAQTVQNTLKKFGVTEEQKGKFASLWASNETEYYDYIDKLRKGYEEIKQKIKDVGTTQKANLPDLKKQKEAIEAIAKALEISLDKGDYGKGKSRAQIDLEVQIDLVKKLQDAYEKLDPYIDDKTMKDTLSKFFPDAKKEWIDSLDFTTILKSLADELEKYSKEAADNLRNSIGKTGIDGEVERLKNLEKGYKETAESAKQYFNTLRKWASEDFNLNGEGIVLDVSKIASDFAAKANEIELSARKAKELFGQIDLSSEESIEKVKAIFIKEFGVDAWGEFWTTYEKEGESAIRNLADAQIAYERKLAQEKLNDLASKYVKEVYFTGNISLEDLGDKTFSQLGNIKKKLQDLLDKDPLQIPLDVYGAIDSLGVDLNNLVGQDLEEIFKSLEGNGLVIDDATKSTLRLTQQIQKAGLSTEQFGEIIKQVIGGDLKNLTEEQSKAFMEMIESYMSEMGNLLSSLSEYAEAIGNDELQGAVNGIAQAMDIIGSMADKLAQGDWIGAIVSGLTSMATVILDAAKAEAELNRQIEETRNEMRLLASQNAINKDVETIFGTDEFKRFSNAYEEAAKAHKQALEDIQKQNEEFKGRSSDNWGAGGVLGAVGAGAAAGAGIGALAGGWFGGITIAAGAVIGGIVGLITGLTGAVATEANDYALTLQEMADSLGADLVDDTTGAFNSETLKSIKEAYTDLDSESKEMLDKLITNAEIYENAITEMANYMTEIFGQCADSMADSFITAFKESGEAALDYEDLMDDVATNIAKSIIKSAILQNIFTEEDAKQAAEKLVSGDAAGAMEIVESAMERAKELTPGIQALLESLKPYMQMEETAGQSLGDGIKGITEDTANLLASYLNAIRADVSYSKVLWQNMDSNLQALAASLANFSAPSLMEYQQQIAANTLNTANHTRDILDTLTGLLVSGNEGSAIRVYM